MRPTAGFYLKGVGFYQSDGIGDYRQRTTVITPQDPLSLVDVNRGQAATEVTPRGDTVNHTATHEDWSMSRLVKELGEADKRSN